MRNLFIVLVATLIPTLASANIVTVDFSFGTLGDLGTNDVTVQGVRVQAVGGNLFRWRGEYCCFHLDLGLGVFGRNEIINAAQPELNPGEFFRLTKPDGYRWRSIGFSSVNNGAAGRLYESIYPAGPTHLFDTSLADSNYLLSLTIINPNTPFLWVTAYGNVGTNFFLLNNVVLEAEVTEPTSLLLLGTGLIGLGMRYRRK